MLPSNKLIQLGIFNFAANWKKPPKPQKMTQHFYLHFPPIYIYEYQIPQLQWTLKLFSIIHHCDGQSPKVTNCRTGY